MGIESCCEVDDLSCLGMLQKRRRLYFQPIFNILMPKCFAPRVLSRTPPGAKLTATPSWERLGHTLAEAPTQLRAPWPRDPTIRHWLQSARKQLFPGVSFTSEYLLIINSNFLCHFLFQSTCSLLPVAPPPSSHLI